MISLEDVSLSYGKNKRAGKSSFLRLIYLGLKPSEGKIRLFGNAPTEANKPFIRRKMGVVFQDCRLVPHLSALGNAVLPLEVGGVNQTTARNNARELLKWVGLGNRLDAMPNELAGGEAQRVAIVRAVVSKPELIIADEPTGNVDIGNAKKLLHLFRELNKNGTTILIATHNEELLKDGEVWRLKHKTLLRLI